MIPRALVAMLMLGASTARAWDATIQLSGATSETSIRGASESSEASSRSKSDSSRSNSSRSSSGEPQANASPQCRIDSDCALSDYCEQGRCVRPVAQNAPVQPVRQMPGCADDSQCAVGYACFQAQCVPRTQQQQQPNTWECSPQVPCAQGQPCVDGRCLNLPPAPPSSSLQRRGSEVYLRERAAQLRQELALGEGPMISTLALERRLSPRSLGRLMREHRAELVVLTDADPAWPGRFLTKLDGLLADQVSHGAETSRSAVEGALESERPGSRERVAVRGRPEQRDASRERSSSDFQ